MLEKSMKLIYEKVKKNFGHKKGWIKFLNFSDFFVDVLQGH